MDFFEYSKWCVLIKNSILSSMNPFKWSKWCIHDSINTVCVLTPDIVMIVQWSPAILRSLLAKPHVLDRVVANVHSLYAKFQIIYDFQLKAFFMLPFKYRSGMKWI